MVQVLEKATQKASLEYTQLQRKLKADTLKLQEDIEECSKQVSAFASLNDVNEQVRACSALQRVSSPCAVHRFAYMEWFICEVLSLTCTCASSLKLC